VRSWLDPGFGNQPMPGAGSLAPRVLPLSVAAVATYATVRLVLLDFGASSVQSAAPFVSPAGAALGVYLAALALVGALLGGRAALGGLAATGLLVLTWATAHELTGLPLLAAWSALFLAGLIALRVIDPPARRLVIRPLLIRQIRFRPWLRLALPAAILAPVLLALGHLFLVDLPVTQVGFGWVPDVPFSSAGTAAAAVVAGAAVLAGTIVGGRRARRAGILVAGAVTAYLVPFEVPAWVVVVLWSLIGAAALVAERLDEGGTTWFRRASIAITALAAVVAFVEVAPPARLVVSASGLEAIRVLETLAAFLFVAGVLALRSWRGRGWRHVRWIDAGATVTAVYLLSVTVVGAFATRIGTGLAVEEIQTQGQVALSVTWAALGAAAFVSGLRLRRPEPRLGGLALIALATGKVFLFDLAALDVAYRVISLVVLGLLLLTSAWLWQRLRPREEMPLEVPPSA
jgi:hypothetical protein